MANINEFEYEEIESGLIIVKYTGKQAILTIPSLLNDKPVKMINRHAFAKNNSIETVIVPNEIEEIYDSVFENCENLKKVVFPKSVKFIQNRAFLGCKSLENINLNDDITEIGDLAFEQCFELSEIILPKNLEKMGNSAFKHCVNLEKIIIPNKVEIIQKETFFGCSKLKEVDLPESVIKIGGKAFGSCNSLEKIQCSHTKEQFKKMSIPKGAFSYNENMLVAHDIVLKAFNEREIKRYYLAKLARFEELNQEEKKVFMLEMNKKVVKEIIFLLGTACEVMLFFELGLKLSLEEIGTYLEHSIKYENTEITAILLRYKDQNFTEEQRENFEENKEMVEIGIEAPSFEQLNVKWNVSSTKEYISIRGYKGKESVEIVPANIITGKPILYIESSSSKNFAPLKHIILPEGIKGILNRAFHFSKIEKIELPDTLETIDTYAFNQSDIKEIIIPNNISIITNNSFSYCENLEKVVLGENVRIIDDCAFRICTTLKEIVFAENLEKIGKASFAFCKNLEKVELPPNLVMIDEYAFNQCVNLKEVKLPENVEILGRKAFFNCTSLKRVILSSEIGELHENTFENCPNLEFVGTENGENIRDKFAVKLFEKSIPKR
ncbi:MAG: leucine-rich repeat domain-containing protein [Eubacteriales bacterium]